MGGQADGDRERGMRPAAGPGLPGPGALAGDSCLHGFAKGGDWDACPPSAALAVALERASGPEWRCPEATKDELAGLLRQWQALESWAAAGKLGVLRALIRDEDEPLPGGGHHGDLPDGWTRSLTHDVALALSMPAVSAEHLMWLAWDLAARLPGTGDLLALGQLTYAKAKAVNEALQPLSEQDAATAESMILPDLPGKTYGQAERLALQAAITVDPESAARRRQDAEQRKSRVEMFREQSGAAALSGRDLPTDQALTAHASVCARAQEYKDSGAFPGDTRMDQYRAAAYLDLLNGIPAEARITTGQVIPVTRADSPGYPADDDGDDDGLHGPGPDVDGPDDGSGPVGRSSDEGASGGGTTNGPGSGGPGPSGQRRGRQRPDGLAPSGSGADPANAASLRLTDLVLPLSTLLGLAERPGEGHALGPLDPDLCRALAASAVASRHTTLCVTITDENGIAIGHGCARPPKKAGQPSKPGTGTDSTSRAPEGSRDRARPGDAGTLGPPTGSEGALPLPSRVNLTIPGSRLTQLTGQPGQSAPACPPGSPADATGPPARPPWIFTRTSDPGPPGGHGTWVLSLPDGKQCIVPLEPMPTFDCDHRHESHAYQPNDTLRHLVQVRDYACTFPSCSRHARECDYEHAVPYDQGGRTCACNAGARSRQCHQVKQSPGWTVTQPRPGWHQWITPSGRTYVQEPKRYPV
jgi:Domain of unknown function (DUF222)